MAAGESGRRSAPAARDTRASAAGKAGRRRSNHPLCLLGLHAPGRDVVWAGGYGFAHCRRCGTGIVRSLLSGWQQPGPGLRIVWPAAGSGTAAPPASTRHAQPSSPEPARAESFRRELPAVDMLPAVDVPPAESADPIDPEPMASSAIDAPPAIPESPPVAARPVSLLPDDFMGKVPSSAATAQPAVRLGPDFDFNDLMRNDDDARGRAAQTGR